LNKKKFYDEVLGGLTNLLEKEFKNKVKNENAKLKT